MSMNTQGRPTAPAAVATPVIDTVSGSRGLLQREDLLFEIGTPETTGVDLPKPKGLKNRLGGAVRKVDTGLAGLSEPQAVRHYMRLSQKNYAIDLGLFPNDHMGDVILVAATECTTADDIAAYAAALKEII